MKGLTSGGFRTLSKCVAEFSKSIAENFYFQEAHRNDVFCPELSQRGASPSTRRTASRTTVSLFGSQLKITVYVMYEHKCFL
jgi:hypothetical protein